MIKYFLAIVFVVALVFAGVWGKAYHTQKQFEQVLNQAEKKIRSSRYKKGMSLDLTEPVVAKATFVDERHYGASNIVWQFATDAPSAFADRRLLSDNDEQCYTDIDITSERCRSVSREAIDHIIQALRQYRESQIAHEKQIKEAQKGLTDAPCEAWYKALPEDYEVNYLVAQRPVKELGFQIRGQDEAGSAHLVDVQVNYPKKPVVLILRYYYPTVWRIHYTPETQIAGVWATGYHSPTVIGVDASTPVLTTSFSHPRCKRHINNSLPLPHIKPWPDEQYIADSHIRIGRYSDNWISHGDVNQLAKDPKKEFPAGDQGVLELLAQGAIRHITYREPAHIQQLQGKPFNYKPKNLDMPIFSSTMYTVEKPMTFPANMYGGYSATFYLPDATIPFPKGNVAHNSVILSSGYCLGVCP